MKVHTNNFKSKIKDFGRELDSKIIYTINGVTTELGSSQLNSVTPHYEANLLKSVMKQLDIDSNVDIPVGTEINYKFGVKTRSGKNLLNIDNWVKGRINNSTGNIEYASNVSSMTIGETDIKFIVSQAWDSGIASDFIPISTGTYAFTYSHNREISVYIDTYNNQNVKLSRIVSYTQSASPTTRTFTISDNSIAYIRIHFEVNTANVEYIVSDMQLEKGSQATSYEKYGAYEYLDYGNYIVYSSEKQEDSRSWKLIAYDKMLNAMKDYENLNITYPITVRNYIIAICNKIGLTFKNASEEFANYDKNILEELYLDADGNSLGYTYRDVLDELSQVTASVICIDKNDNLEIRYINELVNEETTKTGNQISIENARSRELEDFTLLGNITQNGTPTPSAPIPVETVTGGQVLTVCGKNLLPNNQTTQTINGLTFTMNSDKSVSISGTATVNTDYYFVGTSSQYEDFGLTTGTYNLNGCTGGSEQTYMLFAVMNRNGNIYYYNNTTTGGRSMIVETGDKFRIFIRVISGTNVNTTIYPQLEVGNTATAYEPYTGKNYPINLGVENLAKVDYAYDTTTNGVNCKVNSDGSITLKGTASAHTTFVLSTGLGYTTGKYTMSCEGLPNADDIRIRFRNANGSYSVGEVNNIAEIQYNLNPRTFLNRDVNDFEIFIFGGKYVDTTLKVQLEKGSKANSYTPYGTTPIELCKIGSNKDKIFKGKGVNLFDYSYSNLANTTRATVSEENNGFKVTSTGVIGFGYSSLQLDNSLLGKQITISMNSSGDKTPSGRLFYVRDNGTLGTNVGPFWTTNNSHTETLPSTLPDGTKAIALVLYISQSTNASGNYAIFRNIQVQLGNTATEYEPFNSKDKWLLRKEIGKDIYDGSENWSGGNVATDVYRFYRRVDDLYAYTDSRRHIDRHIANRFTLSTDNVAGATYQYQTNLYFCVSGNEATTYNEFKTWLASNNLVVYYILSVPTITQLTDTELINQLDSLKLMYGRNEIFLNSNGTLSFKYISEYETIDENYLKDINVNFGENFGPINSIVLTRAGGSDSVYINNESSINNYGLHEIKIEDNQIMNLNNRADFLPDLLKYLDGIEYFYNDFSSTGICYLDLLDLYTVKIDNNYYNCLMLNDDANITQGLEEQIHTDIAEETETDYQYASKDDRQRTIAYIIAKKNEGEIEALASKVVDLSNTINGVGSITLENAYVGTLHRLEISGSILLIYPSNTLYPSETLTILDTNLLVDTNKYHLDIDRLNYTSATEHDTYIYEDGKSWIERANGTIEPKEDFTIEVTENSAISLEQFPNAIFKCIYLLQNDYTDTFTNSLDIVSKINLSPEKIEINSNKISLAGKTIDLTSELININSKYFKVDSEGNLTASSATLNGRFDNYSPNGKLAISINKTIMKFYDHKGTEAQVGGICSIRGNQTGLTGISLFTIQGSKLTLGYKEQEDNSTIYPLIEYNTNDLTKTPWIKNTANGTIFTNSNNGITVENGLIKNWSLDTSSGTITINEPNGHQVKIIVKSGLISDWQYT